MKKSREEVKIADKQKYDRSHRVVEPKWKVGDKVLLHDSQVKPGAAKVLTKQRYFGPYIIKQVVKGRENVGEAYRLLNETTGKTLKNLVSNDRLKNYNVDRRDYNARLPKLQTAVQQSIRVKPLEIISERYLRGKKRYMVKYSDGQTYLCDWVNKPLLQNYKKKRNA